MAALHFSLGALKAKMAKLSLAQQNFSHATESSKYLLAFKLLTLNSVLHC